MSTRVASEGSVQPVRSSLVALGSVLAVLLFGFVVVVGREVAATVGVWSGGRGDSYQLFAVSLTGLMSAVFTYALGASRGTRQLVARGAASRLRARFGDAYVVTYTLAGAAALLVCLARLGSSTTLLRSLAATFLGTSVAAVSVFFGVAQPDD